MNVRNIEEGDIKACAVLFSSVFSSNPWREPWTVPLAFERLYHFYISRGFVGVLAEADGIQGFALGNIEPYCDGPIFYLREMCVHNDTQNKGVGTQVMAYLEAALHEVYVKSIYLATEKGISAAAFYKKRGFTCSETTAFFEKEIYIEYADTEMTVDLT